MRTFRIGGILLAAATMLAVAATPAISATVPTPSEESSLTLLVWGRTAGSEGVELRCAPPGGSHPDPRAACEALDKADGDFAQLKAPQTFACTMELRQVTAIAVGTWEGETVRWHQQFSNPCVLRAETGGVFDF